MSKVTIFDQACNKIEGFVAMGEHFMRQLVINRLSTMNIKSTYPGSLVTCGLAQHDLIPNSCFIFSRFPLKKASG